MMRSVSDAGAPASSPPPSSLPPSSRASSSPPPAPPNAKRDLLIAAVVALVACGAAAIAPRAHEATVVGAVFLGATWWLVLRADTAQIREHGLGIGGLLEPDRLDPKRLASSVGRAALWAVIAAAVTWPFFAVGLPIYYGASRSFSLPAFKEPLDLVLGQVFVIALPEEAFFRGFLQSRLDRAWPRRWRVLGADVGVSIVVTSVMFAIAHVLTLPHPARLAVFFPSLLFGWLRARTGGIGASVLFHAGCNLMSMFLRDGYGV
jgi:membrane protease YdiL (CAAX protease family)